MCWTFPDCRVREDAESEGALRIRVRWLPEGVRSRGAVHDRRGGLADRTSKMIRVLYRSPKTNAKLISGEAHPHFSDVPFCALPHILNKKQAHEPRR